ncbi:MAG: RlmE family RNA methyltransferase [Spirochaetales bacterium]|jgi:23S rRNA (uridine2552-2'-O)-methyltransferase|nr:RlmE family RNA methyltransferase [Spirochaetales bacterium]
MREISDHWTEKAKKEGYPARSVYKLKEIQEKFRLIPAGARVLDLGASPGSWSLFVLRTGGRRRVTAVDLSPLTGGERENLLFYQGDIFAPETAAFLEKDGPYDVLLSDAAPWTTGNRSLDAARSEALVEKALALAQNLVKTGGSCAVKIFQGSGNKKILDHMKTLFASVKAFKPQATRSESFETYFIGCGKKT